NVEDKILVTKLPKNYARCVKCGHPVNGSYCQGCTLLREKHEEDLVTYFQNFQNTSESSDDSTNVVNAPRKPVVVKQDHGVNPPHIDECCCKCGDALDGIFCQQCTCFDQTQPLQLPVIHPPPQETSIEILHDQENVINSIQTFLRKFNRYSFFEMPKVLLLAWDRIFEIKDALGTKQNKPEDIQELFRQLLNDVQNIHEELAEYINTSGWNRPTFYDDDDDDNMDHTIAITPVLSTEETKNSLKNIEYVEASPHDSEVVSLEVAEIVIPEVEEIEDDNLRKKLLNVRLLIANIEALKDNPTPSFDFRNHSMLGLMISNFGLYWGGLGFLQIMHVSFRVEFRIK
nr:hypothetical protein [Tanacetum cinerariifolium]